MTGNAAYFAAKPMGNLVTLKGTLPGENAQSGERIKEKVILHDAKGGRTAFLTRKISEGGEGSVFETSLPDHVAKIYHRRALTEGRIAKIEYMVAHSSGYSTQGICFPESIVLNEQREVVGHLMVKATGYELGKSVLIPKLLAQRFPAWKKRDTIDLCLTILRMMKVLNDHGIIMGDINPANILVVSPQKVYFVDCDSYQVNGYPCPVGTPNFTPPEAIGKNFKTFLRTQEMENFAIATLLFMIMMPGKPPYSSVGGASPAENIKNGLFPYPHMKQDGDKTPPGRWGFIWSHMSYDIRLAFFETFKKGEKHFAPSDRYGVDEWIKQFEKYRNDVDLMVNNDSMSGEMLPSRLKSKRCKDCGNRYVPDPERYSPYCEKCRPHHSKYPRTSTRTKLCPQCKANYIEPRFDYCLDCKGKLARRASTGASRPVYTAPRRPVPVPAATRVGASTTSKIVSKPQTSAPATSQMPSSSSKNRQNGPSTATSYTWVWICLIAFVLIAVLIGWSSHGAQDAGYGENESYGVNETYWTQYAAAQQSAVELDRDVQLGDIVFFGSYEQGLDENPDPIAWYVISKSDGRALLISQAVLECMPYGSKDNGSIWQGSNVRAWLNDDFMAGAFSDEERAKIAPTDLGDSVFILDQIELDMFFRQTGLSEMAFLTPHAYKQGGESWTVTEDLDSGGVNSWERCGSWWLRMPGSEGDSVVVVEGCEINTEGRDPTSTDIGVCPAVWVTL